MTKGPVVIITYVEAGSQTDEDRLEVDRDEWDAMTPNERYELCIDAAVTHQNNWAPCGWDIDDQEDRESVARE
jgi:hypothetical protein